MVSVGRSSDKIILILLYANYWVVSPRPGFTSKGSQIKTVFANRKRTVFASICPKKQPEYYEEVKSILSTPGNNDEQKLAVVFDYAFQFLLDHLMSEEGAVKGPCDLQRSVDIADIEDDSVTHRFLATAPASFLEEPVTRELTPRVWIGDITMRYEMLKSG